MTGTTNGRRFRTILVATDFSEEDSSALRYAQQLAAAHKSVLVVMHAIDPVGYAFPDGVPAGERLGKSAREALKAIEEGARKRGIPVHSVVETGVVYERILQATHDHHADLLVLGTGAKGRLGRAALGTVARHLITHAHCPVLTVPADAEPRVNALGKWHRLLVAIDFSRASLAALRHAQSAATDKLVVMHAVENRALESSNGALWRLRILAPAGDAVAPDVEHVILNGKTAEAVNELVQRTHPDMVVLGSPLNDLSEKELHQSTILNVVSGLGCPALCVPGTESAAA